MSPICVLVPAYMEANGILDAVLYAAVEEVGSAHVYLTTDASADSTADVARYWLPASNVDDPAENRGKARALEAATRRFGLTERYEGIFILDADCILSRGHIAALVEHLEPGTAFLVGNLQSNYGLNRTLWGRYRAFMYHAFNLFIRAPQDLLKTINVLPGSSVLIRSGAVAALDWDEIASYSLDDYDALVQIRRGGFGEARYIADTPPAYILEPYTFGDYWKQTRRWWTGIRDIYFGERVYSHWRRRWAAWDTLHLGSWVLSALAPVVALPVMAYALTTSLWWVVAASLGFGLAQNLVIAGLYVAKTGRVSALFLLPVFAGIAYLESLHFAAAFIGLVKKKSGAAWVSPDRTSPDRKRA